MLGSGSQFRDGQWEAIEAVAVHRQRALVVQRTGWSKSIVYFLATKLLREQAAGSTLLISPLLSLMRNQIAMTERIGIRANTIHSANQKDWAQVEEALRCDECDILLISPERLNNPRFIQQVLPRVAGKIGLFVVDEAHCISDWGHDFRPDYRRITRIIQMLPRGVPVLGTTATANDRVVADVASQLGPNLMVQRGPLGRASLRLQTIRLANQSERLAWLVENLPKLLGSGVIYCLTVPDTERVAAWLRQKGIPAEAYHAGEDSSLDRPALEQAFLQNDVKILVATVALGMGFDKPDIGFVIHFQRPGSVVAYYQQVGRAGRALNRAYGILLSGVEDDEIQNYFIESAFPTTRTMLDILAVLEQNEGLGLYELLSRVNVTASMAEKALKLLEVDGAVGMTYDHKTVYFRTPNPWQPDTERVERVLNLRRAELAQMQAYVAHPGCLMEFLQRALDDPNPQPCGRCANCRGKGFSSEVSQELVIEAETFLKGATILIQPRKRWPVGLFPDQKATIPPEVQNAEGRSLCYYGDAGWGKLVRNGKYQDGRFSDELVMAAAHVIRDLWKPELAWVTAVPSRRHSHLVPDLAQRLALQLDLPFYAVLERVSDAPEQKTMQNSSMQARNVVRTLGIRDGIPDGPVLLVDDILDSGWTLTMAGYLLRTHGSGLVYPFTLAQATGRNA
jgi:ATP-dependent DNA helicase RecQ